MNNNPTGINQYSGGGRGGHKLIFRSPSTGSPSSYTRDAAAKQVLMLKKALKTTKLKRDRNEMTAMLKNFRSSSRKYR